MSLKKKIISAVTVLGLMTSALGFSGCSAADRGTALTIDGKVIPAGLYILYSGVAYSEAQTKFREDNPDVDTYADDFDYKSQTVDGKAFDEYVKEKALEGCQRHAAINKLYDEGGMSADEEQAENLASTVATQWDFSLTDWISYIPYAKGYDTLGAYYEHIGVSKASLKEFYAVNQYKSGSVFDSYYEKGGSKEVSDSEISSYIDENYVLTRYFTISLTSEDGEDADRTAELEKLANDYVKQLNDGTAYKDVYAKYQDYLNPDNEDSADAADSDEETEDTDYNRVVNKEDETPSEEFVESLFKQSKNSAQLFKTDENLYVVQKLDILTESLDGKKYTETYRSSALSGLKTDEYEDVLKEVYSAAKVEMNTGIPDYCKEQAENASNALSTVGTIQYMSYYSSMMGY
ncbi:MAG: hypothetical protein NC203_04010 [Firmicutes bacterium]|nr:hypothetical protein [[Eubacterium] siraeum]MCM1487513.1 hypothetical protein [Bacillota bacterium]